MKHIFTALVVFALTGNAVSANDLENSQQIEIEKQSSVIAGIGPVALTQFDSSIELRGVVRRVPLRRGPIKGSLHIEVLGADNRILQIVDTGYRRPGASSRYARLNVILDVDPTQVRVVRISHRTGQRT